MEQQAVLALPAAHFLSVMCEVLPTACLPHQEETHHEREEQCQLCQQPSHSYNV